MLESAGGVGFCVDAGGLLELERAFERDLAVPAAAEEEGTMAVGDVLRLGPNAGLEFQARG